MGGYLALEGASGGVKKTVSIDILPFIFLWGNGLLLGLGRARAFGRALAEERLGKERRDMNTLQFGLGAVGISVGVIGVDGSA